MDSDGQSLRIGQNASRQGLPVFLALDVVMLDALGVAFDSMLGVLKLAGYI
jgi:hypothetical protein